LILYFSLSDSQNDHRPSTLLSDIIEEESIPDVPARDNVLTNPEKIQQSVLPSDKKEKIKAKRSRYGNLMIKETCLVIDEDKRYATILGREDENGKVVPLNQDDINACKEKRIGYKV